MCRATPSLTVGWTSSYSRLRLQKQAVSLRWTHSNQLHDGVLMSLGNICLDCLQILCCLRNLLQQSLFESLLLKQLNLVKSLLDIITIKHMSQIFLRTI